MVVAAIIGLGLGMTGGIMVRLVSLAAFHTFNFTHDAVHGTDLFLHGCASVSRGAHTHPGPLRMITTIRGTSHLSLVRFCGKYMTADRLSQLFMPLLGV